MFKMGKSIRDKNRKGGNCHSEKPNLHRWLGKCKILKINLKKKKFWESWVPSSRIGNFPQSWCRDQISGEEGSAGKWIPLVEVKSSCFNLKVRCRQWLWNWDATVWLGCPQAKSDWELHSHGMTRASLTLLVTMCMWMDCTYVATVILGNEVQGLAICFGWRGKAQLPRSGSKIEKYQPDWRMLFRLTQVIYVHQGY